MKKRNIFLIYCFLTVYLTHASPPDSCERIVVVLEEIPMAMQSKEKPVYKKDTLIVHFIKTKSIIFKEDERMVKNYFSKTKIKHFGQVKLTGCANRNPNGNELLLNRKKSVAKLLEKYGIPPARIEME